MLRDMQINGYAAPTTVVEDESPFTTRWNGWLVSIIAVLSIVTFVVIQIIITAVIMFRSLPGLAQFPFISPETQRQLTDPNFFIGLLNAKNLWLLSVLSEGALFLTTVGLLRGMLGAGLRALGFRRGLDRSEFASGVAMGIVLFFASAVIGAVLTKIFGPHPQPQAQALLKHHGAWDFALDFMSVSVAAPLAEETFFRGLIFTSLAQRLPVGWAAVLSAAAFGLAHLERWSFLSIFAIGLGLAYLYYRTRNLWVNIVAHAVVNGISLVLAFTVPQLVNS